MESSKCRKCGEEPFFVEHLEKWYCYSCNSYTEEGQEHTPAAEPKIVPEEHVQEPVKEENAPDLAMELKALEEEAPVCEKCGAALETKDGKQVCAICGMDSVPEADEEEKPSDAQEIIDQLFTPAPVEVKVEPIEVKPEPIQVEAPIQVAAPPVVEAKTDKGVKMCPNCGQPLKWIDKYSRFYCYSCKKYAPNGFDAKPKPVPVAAPQAQDTKKCPDCGGELRFIEKYNEHYCNACKSYPLHKKSAPEKPKEEIPPKPAVQLCAKCGKPLKFIEKYDRHYCYECRTYAPKSVVAAPAKPKEEKKVCPVCGDEMKFVSQYNEWYCYKCKKYTLRPSKPMLLM